MEGSKAPLHPPARSTFNFFLSPALPVASTLSKDCMISLFETLSLNFEKKNAAVFFPGVLSLSGETTMRYHMWKGGLHEDNDVS